MPGVHSDLLERLVFLTGSVAAVVGKRASLKQIVKTMSASGALAPEDGPLGGALQTKGHRGRGKHVRVLFGEGKEAVRPPAVSWMHEG